MRHGLISWSREEVPASVLETRVSRLQKEMRKTELGAVLVYTSFARPSAVAWLTHFVPYWNEALLLVLPADAPILFAAFSKRMHHWIREVSHVGEVRSAPDLGRTAATYLKEHPPAPSRIGVVELDALPWSVAEPIVKNGFGGELVDATDVFAANRQPADEVEIRLARRAADIAAKAFEAIPARARRASDVLAALEASARLDGAEEVLVRIACDLGTDPTLRRMEGDAPLGERWAVELAVAYKAAWVRITRCRSVNEPPQSWRNAVKWFAGSVERLDESCVVSGPGATGANPPGRLSSWILESCIGSQPLSVVAGDGQIARRALPAGALASVSVRVDLDDGPWLGGGPFVIGGRGRPGILLA